MKKFGFFIGIIVALVAALSIIGAAVRLCAPKSFSAMYGAYNLTEKITGRYIVEKVAKTPETVTIFGSSELRTYDIPTHPSNVFFGENEGFSINIVGRGSCQSIIHALNIASNGEALEGKKVVLITSPQSYVEGGIAPDLFMANFSEQQFLHIMNSKSISDELKARFAERVGQLFENYEAQYGKNPQKYTAAGLNAWAFRAGGERLRRLLLPLNLGAEWLLDTKDAASAWKLSRRDSALFTPILPPVVRDNASDHNGAAPVDWEALEIAALDDAAARTSNNDFGMLDDYYNTYIGRRLSQQAGKDAELSYTESPEYDDLRLLLDVCEAFGIRPLFVHVPLHGEWSDYTGFSSERREEYYEKVRNIVNEYENVSLLDLTSYEYEEYFLCDVMHLGWKGWLAVGRAIVEYYSFEVKP